MEQNVTLLFKKKRRFVGFIVERTILINQISIQSFFVQLVFRIAC